MSFLRILLVISLLLGGFVSPAAGMSAYNGCHMSEKGADDCCGDGGRSMHCSGLSCNSCGTPLALVQPLYISFLMPSVIELSSLRLIGLRDIVYLNFRPPDFLS